MKYRRSVKHFFSSSWKGHCIFIVFCHHHLKIPNQAKAKAFGGTQGEKERGGGGEEGVQEEEGEFTQVTVEEDEEDDEEDEEDEEGQLNSHNVNCAVGRVKISNSST